MKWIGLGLVLAAILVLWLGKPDPLYYRQHPIELTIIDEETGKPIEGAVVVAVWSITGGKFNARKIGVIDIQEAVSDKNGDVLLPGFDKQWREFFPGTYLDFTQPELTVYKYRYEAKHYYNRQAPDRLLKRNHPAEMKWWGDQQIELIRSPESEIKRAEKFIPGSREQNPVLSIIPDLSVGCIWERMKNMIIEYDKQMQDVERLGLYDSSLEPWFSRGAKQLHHKECLDGVEWIKSVRRKQANS